MFVVRVVMLSVVFGVFSILIMVDGNVFGIIIWRWFRSKSFQFVRWCCC